MFKNIQCFTPIFSLFVKQNNDAIEAFEKILSMNPILDTSVRELVKQHNNCS